MRARFLVLGTVATASVTLGLIACVGDSPLPNNGVDAATDVASNDVSNGTDATKPDGGSSDGGTCATPQQCPTSVQPGKLALWLQGDDVQCDTSVNPARVTLWPDHSGAGRNAKPRNTYVGPRCGANAETVKGKTAPAFRPTWGDKDGGVAFDEVLDVDLSWIAASDYTIFAVERRSKIDTHPQGVITTEYFSFNGASEPGLGSCSTDTSTYIEMAYAVTGGPPPLGYYVHRCGNPAVTPGAIPTDGGVATVPNLIVLRFSQNTGRSWFLNGASVGSNADKVPIKLPAVGQSFSGGIGRLHNARLDGRFYGTITEVIGYSVALSDTERQTVEAYLTTRWR